MTADLNASQPMIRIRYRVNAIARLKFRSPPEFHDEIRAKILAKISRDVALPFAVECFGGVWATPPHLKPMQLRTWRS